jgi:hypothetical protein
MDYRLEYSEAQGCFHFENTNTENKNTNSYHCLCHVISSYEAEKFTRKMLVKYPFINSGNIQFCPNLQKIKEEFELFLTQI